MPWLLKNGHGSAFTSLQMDRKGDEEVWARMRAHKGAYSRAYLDEFDKERWAKATLRFIRQPKLPVHALPSARSFIFSDTIKRIIDTFEPGLHSPLRVTVLNQDRSPWPEPFWYYHHDHIRKVEALDLEESNIQYKYDEKTGYDEILSPSLYCGYPKYKIETRTFIDARKVLGLHLYGDSRAPGAFKYYFFSDEIVDVLRDAKLLRSFKLGYIGLTHGDRICQSA